ncbi:MAG: hypothetical protein HC905_12340 [Bacteroidales bacterium]|nr:hypothetical protein [Bacteroidales bacterium]
MGTPGGVIYQHSFASEKARSLTGTNFFTLRKNSRLIGNIAFCRRDLADDNNENLTGYYIRYLSVMPSFRRNISHKKMDTAKKMVSKNHGIIKEHMENFFKNAEKYLSDKSENKKYIFYAHIEDENQRSLMLSQNFGYQRIGWVETTIFTRVFPKKHKRIEQIHFGEHEKMKNLLGEFYKDHAMYHTQNLFYKNNYYVFKEKNEIIAGIQANVITWKIKHMPGITGKMLLRILPYIPFLSRMFNPGAFRFLAFEYLYIREGYEKSLTQFIEGVCALKKTHVGLIWTDIRQPIHKILAHYVYPGMIHKISKKMTAGIL